MSSIPTLESLKSLPQKPTCGLLRMLAEDVNNTLAKASRASPSKSSCEVRDVLSDNWVWCGIEVTDKTLYKECYENHSDSSSCFGDDKNECLPAETNLDSYQNISPALETKPGEPVKYPYGSVFYPWSYRVSQRMERSEKEEAEVNEKWLKYFKEQQALKAVERKPSKGTPKAKAGSFQEFCSPTTSKHGKLTPYGSSCHNYVCVKKCKASIYEQRLQEQVEQAEKKRTLQRYCSEEYNFTSMFRYNDDYQNTSCPQLQRKRTEPLHVQPKSKAEIWAKHMEDYWSKNTDETSSMEPDDDQPKSTENPPPKKNQLRIYRSQPGLKQMFDVRSYDEGEKRGRVAPAQRDKPCEMNRNQACSLTKKASKGKIKRTPSPMAHILKKGSSWSHTRDGKGGKMKFNLPFKPIDEKMRGSFGCEKKETRGKVLPHHQSFKSVVGKKGEPFSSEKGDQKGKGKLEKKHRKEQNEKQVIAEDSKNKKAKPKSEPPFKPWDEKRWSMDQTVMPEDGIAEGDQEKKETRNEENDKYIIQFTKPNGFKCKVVAKNGAIQAETLRCLKMIILKVDVHQLPENSGYLSGCSSVRPHSSTTSRNNYKIPEEDPVRTRSLENAHSVSWIKNNVRETGISHSAKTLMMPQGQHYYMPRMPIINEKPVYYNQFGKVKVEDLTFSLAERKKVHVFSDTYLDSRRTMPWCDASCYLGNPGVLSGLRVTEACFCPHRPNMMLTLHTNLDTDDDSCISMLVCVWNINRPSAPVRFLTSDEEVKCLCFSPMTARLAFAGMSDGSVGVWDLEETDSLHIYAVMKSEEFLLRFPTYYSPQAEDLMGHFAPIINITTVLHGVSGFPSGYGCSGNSASSLSPGNKSSTTTTNNGEEFDSFHVAGLTEAGVVIIWQMIENKDLSPYPRLGLNMVLQVSLTQEIPDCLHLSSLGTLILQLNLLGPKNEDVKVDQPKRASLPIASEFPELFVGGYLGFSSSAPCIRLSPFCKFCFLAGSVDGKVYLCHTQRPRPIICFTLPPEPRDQARIVEWSPSRPGVFFVLCGDSTLNIFDLLENRQHPIRTQRLHDQPILTMVLSPDLRYNDCNRVPYRPRILLTTADGSVILRTLSSVCTERQGPDEKRFLESLVNRK